ncbi:MAG: Gfo/Idh/MocA family oxidoreductase [Anaerolineae bacterium]|nr:Gfo/Idh/MocA family oxidoreductase [Anaerolineae bacterium]
MVSGKDEEAFFPRKLKMGMVGGGRGAFIGAVHRRAAMLDGGVELVAGCFSSTPEKSKLSGKDLYLPDERVYGTWEEMLEKESKLPEGERIDFVSVVTPNHMHYPVAKAFVEAGFNVVCDKPLVHTVEQALDLVKAVREHDVVFAVTYNYTGYPMVKQARHLVRSGALGKIQKVIVEYPQGWLLRRIEEEGQKQAVWRTDPRYSGVSGCIGDIGSHCENLVSYITGLELEAICADLTIFAPGRKLDDDGNILLRFKGGAKGILTASQVCPGQENSLRIRVWGTKAGLEWSQEDPNYLYVRSNDGPEMIYKRGNAYLCEAAAAATRLPSGHPEAFIEAFANVYKNFTDTVRAKLMGVEPNEIMLDFPTVVDGARGVFFIHKAVESSKSDLKWTPAEFSLD